MVRTAEVYITGDIHGEPERFKDPAIKRLRRGDTLIICGDFGFVWDGSKAEQHRLKGLSRRRYNIAFVDGVHENHALLNTYPVTEWNGGKVHNIKGRLFHLMRGQVYNISGKTIFTLGGGENPELNPKSAEAEACLPTIDELYEANENLQKVDYTVDYIVTHECSGNVKGFINMDDNSYNHLYAFLNDAAKVIEYKKWFFGCHHIDKVIPPKYICVFKAVHLLD
ncbi:MAG: hypothetical protein RR423_00340 [Hydrogenoanaerobacterium sp.]